MSMERAQAFPRGDIPHGNNAFVGLFVAKSATHRKLPAVRGERQRMHSAGKLVQSPQKFSRRDCPQLDTVAVVSRGQ